MVMNPLWAAMPFSAGRPERALMWSATRFSAPAAARRAAARAEKRVADHIKARAGRPAENGIAAHSGFITKDDPSRLKREDFEEIAKRAARGETIRF